MLNQYVLDEQDKWEVQWLIMRLINQGVIRTLGIIFWMNIQNKYYKYWYTSHFCSSCYDISLPVDRCCLFNLNLNCCCKVLKFVQIQNYMRKQQVVPLTVGFTLISCSLFPCRQTDLLGFSSLEQMDNHDNKYKSLISSSEEAETVKASETEWT